MNIICVVYLTVITCEEPFIPRNGRLRRSRESYYIGISITFECEEGYALEGSAPAVCQKDTGLSHLGTGGKWSVESPVCKREYSLVHILNLKHDSR